MSDETVNPENAFKRFCKGGGKKADRFVEAATVLAAGFQQHYGFDVPIHEVILPAAGMVWIAANTLAKYLKEG